MTIDVPPLASGRRTLFEALIARATPVEPLDIPEWADGHRVVSAKSGSPRPGLWRTALMPHTEEPMRCMHPDHPARRVTLKWGAQLGKTEIGVNVFGYFVDRAPAPMLIMLPSLDEAIKYNRIKLQPTIDDSPAIRLKVRSDNDHKEQGSTGAFKVFPGGFAQIVSASSSKALQMISVKLLVAEEITGYPLDVDGRGPPLGQAMARQKAYDTNLKQLLSGTPGLSGICEVTRHFEEGDKRRRYVACPHCEARQILTPDALQAPSEATGWRASFACLSCGGVIEEESKPALIAGAVWVPTIDLPPDEPDGEPAKVPDVFSGSDLSRYSCAPKEGRCSAIEPSYALWTAYSPLESWTTLWNEWQEAKQSPLRLKVFWQQYFGESWEETGSEVEHEKLHAARVEVPSRIVTLARPLVTGFIDVQGDRLEWAAYAWGPQATGQLLDKGVIPHAPETAEAVAGIDALLAQTWPAETGGVAEPAMWGIDGSAYSSWVRLVGAGRGHRLRVCEGSEKRLSPIMGTPKRREVKDRYGRVITRCLVYPTGVFDLKHTVYRGLHQMVRGPAESGAWLPGTILLPRDLVDEAYCRQLTAEVCVDPQQQAKGNARRRLHQKPGDHRIWVKRAGWANEALDIAVGCRALAWACQVDTMGPVQWDRWRERLAPPEGAADLFTVAEAARGAPAPIDALARLAAYNNGA